MATPISTVNTAADTFQVWIDKFNASANAISNVVVTANSLANGSLTTGNGFVNGIFGANTLVVTTLRGGNVQAAANLTISSNVSMDGLILNINSTSTINIGSLFINSIAMSVPNTISIGNSTINSVHTGSSLSIGANVVANTTALVIGANVIANTTSLVIGNSTVNTVHTAASLSVGSNVVANTSTLLIGNSTVNVTVNSISVIVGITTVNNSTIALGSNVVVNTSTIFVGNSTVNTVHNATSLSVGSNVIANTSALLIGNSTVNVTVNSSSISIGGSSYSNLTPRLTIANNGVNVGTQPVLNIIPGAQISIAVSNNANTNSIDFTINSGVTGNTVVAGSNTQIQYNDSGSLQGSADLTYDKVQKLVTVANTIAANNINLVNSRTSTINVTTTGLSDTLIDTFAVTDFRGGEYVLTIKDNTVNAYQIEKLLIIHDGGSPYITSYGLINTNNNIGLLSANANTTFVRVYITPATANTTVKGIRDLVAV